MKALLKRILGYGAHTAVLLYHRIASPDYDPWELAVSEEDFEAQLDWLKKHAIVTSLEEIASKPKYGGTKPRIGICFDDGYLDNFETAAPLLVKKELPATFFISTHYLQTGDVFWWDRLASIFFEAQQLPSLLILEDEEDVLRIRMSDLALNDQNKKPLYTWKAGTAPVPDRASGYLEAWQWLKAKEYSSIAKVLAGLERQVHATAKPGRLVMTKTELQQLAVMPGITIAAHTVTHPALRTAGNNLHREIKESVSTLQNWTGKSVRLFSYPYGDVDERVEYAARSVEGLSAAFTTERKAVIPDVNPFMIPRFAVTPGAVESIKQIVDQL